MKVDAAKEYKDFLSVLINDELYSQDESLMIDECVTFFVGATHSTTITVANALFFLTLHQDIRETLLQEIAEQLNGVKDKNKITVQEWQKCLSYDNLQNKWSYLMMVTQETLRLCPPVTATSILSVSETVTLAEKYTIPKALPFAISIYSLHTNPKEWQEPEKFIPERWDPHSKYYLTPDAKKRNPSSFCPFLGGRRICLGKTLAENLVKLMIPIIISQVDFKFKNEEHYHKKPLFSIHTEPKFETTVSIRTELEHNKSAD